MRWRVATSCPGFHLLDAFGTSQLGQPEVPGHFPELPGEVAVGFAPVGNQLSIKLAVSQASSVGWSNRSISLSHSVLTESPLGPAMFGLCDL